MEGTPGSIALPCLPTVVAIVRRPVECRTLIDEKLSRVCLQFLDLSGWVIASKDVFLTFYTPRRPFALVSSDDEASAFLEEE